MNNPLRLHYAPDNASLCVRLALEEIGLPYETVLVDRRQNAQRSDAFLALNPNGLIPVLETPNGPMFETGAILLWLAEEHQQLMPPIGDAQRAHALQWLTWISNTLHPAQRMLFYPDQFAASPATTERTRERLMALLSILENAKTAPWLDDDAASAHTCYLAPMLRWCALYGGDPSWFDLRTRWPRLYDFARRAEQRPAAQRAARAEGLGDTPFSNPSPPNPPEGSAL